MVQPRPLEAALDRDATASDPAERARVYHEATDLWMAALPYLPLYQFTWFWGLSNCIAGFSPRPNGLFRPVGMSMRP